MRKESIIKTIYILFAVLSAACLGKSASAATLEDLQNKFPNGAYWNHVVQKGHGYNNYQDVGPCNNPDGYTWTPCATHNGNVSIGGHDCNTFGNAMQCCGFAKKLAYDLYGSTHSSWGKTSIGNAKPGDVIHYYGTDTDATSGHWAMIIRREGNTLTFGECNVGPNCKISWGRSMDVSKMSSYTIYSAPQEASANHIPEGSLDIVASENGLVRFAGWSFDRDSVSTAVSIHVYMDDNVCVGTGVADKKRTDVHQAYGLGEYHGFDFKLLIKNPGAHTFKVFAINIGKDGKPAENANPCLGSKSVNVVVDETPPVISDVKIIAQDSSGYTVECKVTDNMVVDRVQCPTWTVANGQDDIQKDWPTGASAKATDKGNGIYQYRVNISDHQLEYGQYKTHIYAYDPSGNYKVSTLIVDVVDSKASASGDVNRDGKIDGKDISMLLQYRLGKRELTQEQIAAGDVYQDGKIDGKDVSRLLQYRLGKIESLG